MNTLEKAVQDMVSALNPEYEDNPDMKETPARVVKMYEHFFRNEDYAHHFAKVFPTDNDQMVIVKDIECFGMCPHHLLPIVYSVDIGYIPNGLALGLSKLARIAIAIASYPKLQENMTKEVADVFERHLNPLGIMIVVRGIHNCMRCRGVEQNAETITSDCRGVLRDKPEARMEYLLLSQK